MKFNIACFQFYLSILPSLLSVEGSRTLLRYEDKVANSLQDQTTDAVSSLLEEPFENALEDVPTGYSHIDEAFNKSVESVSDILTFTTIGNPLSIKGYSTIIKMKALMNVWPKINSQRRDWLGQLSSLLIESTVSGEDSNDQLILDEFKKWSQTIFGQRSPTTSRLGYPPRYISNSKSLEKIRRSVRKFARFLSKVPDINSYLLLPMKNGRPSSAVRIEDLKNFVTKGIASADIIVAYMRLIKETSRTSSADPPSVTFFKPEWISDPQWVLEHGMSHAQVGRNTLILWPVELEPGHWILYFIKMGEVGDKPKRVFKIYLLRGESEFGNVYPRNEMDADEAIHTVFRRKDDVMELYGVEGKTYYVYTVRIEIEPNLYQTTDPLQTGLCLMKAASHLALSLKLEDIGGGYSIDRHITMHELLRASLYEPAHIPISANIKDSVASHVDGTGTLMEVKWLEFLEEKGRREEEEKKRAEEEEKRIEEEEKKPQEKNNIEVSSTAEKSSKAEKGSYVAKSSNAKKSSNTEEGIKIQNSEKHRENRNFDTKMIFKDISDSDLQLLSRFNHGNLERKVNDTRGKENIFKDKNHGMKRKDSEGSPSNEEYYRPYKESYQYHSEP